MGSSPNGNVEIEYKFQKRDYSGRGDYYSLMGIITKFCGFMAAASFLAIPLALFTDTSTGANAYTASDAFFAWIFFSFIFFILRRKLN